MSKEVIIYHTDISKNPSLDDLDVLREAEFVSKNVRKLGYSPKSLPFICNIKRIKSEIKKINPDFIFNLVESIGGTDSLAYLATLIFDHLKIPYTGCPTKSLFQTSDKLITKEILNQNGINTPKYLSLDNHDKLEKPLEQGRIERGEKFLIKYAKEHSSVGIDERDLILFEDWGEITERLKEKHGEKYFAEQYIEGREFNISLLGNPITVLPIAEMKFSNYPDEKPKIVGYRAKWNKESFEYNHTKRSFDLGENENPLLKNLEEICIKCWNLFGLKGYARIDFRVDGNNIPYVLEINANPCISPDAGFIASAERAELSHTKVIEKIIEDINKKENPNLF
jgi:D-alanine-D-alanine ligase